MLVEGQTQLLTLNQMFETSTATTCSQGHGARAASLKPERSRLNTTTWKLVSRAHTRLCDLPHPAVTKGNDSISLTALTVSCLF